MTDSLSQPKKPLALVVDDDRDFLALMNRMLGKLDFSSAFAVDGEEFIQKFKATPPDLCFVDLKLGNAMIGFQLLEMVRITLDSDIPLFVTSAESDSRIIAHAMEMGATDYLVKPLQQETLALKLSSYFSSDALVKTRAAYTPIPKDLQLVTLSLNLDLRSADEDGITLMGRHLIVKGSKIRVSNPLVYAMTGRSQPLEVTVVNTWAEPELGLYGAYAEFDGTDEALLTSVRRWLLSRSVSGD